MDENGYLEYIQSLPQQDIDYIIANSEEYLTGTGYTGYPNQYPGVDRGKSIFCTGEQCAAYMAAYGKRHRQVLNHIFSGESFESVHEMIACGFDLYDWACGQGIGTLTLLENLYETGLLGAVYSITLMEPSSIACNIAEYHINKLYSTTRFTGDINKLNIDLSVERNQGKFYVIRTPMKCSMHILSNIIDIANIDLPWIVSIITHMCGDHVVITSDPLFNEYRITEFLSYIESEVPRIIYKKQYRNEEFGYFHNGKQYGCINNIISFNISDEYSTRSEVKGIRIL
ncbi:hypothetical protein [Desulfovibrio sp. ZJ369]|uniref:hypothetical protein n=1 Tax=Desulfovibrio sp. ZJ369 TaxID=2709793 RepID=UPI0013EDC702|nr:hypothetical protein [Desulfovibrio sp. ZJ369]